MRRHNEGPFASSPPHGTNTLFGDLLKQWKADERPTSSMIERAMHPAYLKIIGLGPSALPLILRELEREPAPWFWALEALAREDPVPEADRGRTTKMVEAWLNWGRLNG